MHAICAPPGQLSWFLDHLWKEYPKEFDQYVNSKNQHGAYPLKNAIATHELENAKILLPFNTNENQLDAFHLACGWGKIEFVQHYNMDKIPDSSLLLVAET
jgi:hypothetical protein